MLSLTTGQLESWLAQYLWPFIRIGACFMAAPVFGAGFVPARVRLLLAGAVTLIVAPLVSGSPVSGPLVSGPLASGTLVPGLSGSGLAAAGTPVAAAQIALFSGAGAVIAIQQVIIGLATGFALQIIFDAVTMGGQLLSNMMGLSFAFNVDPLRGASTPVVGQFYVLLVTLAFLALDGHLVLIEILAQGLTALPPGTAGLDGPALWNLVAWGGQLFSGALAIALPGMAALLVVNLAFGVMSRAAPTLNLFAVGFPATLIAGLAIVWASLSSVQAGFGAALQAAFDMLGSLAGLN